MSAEVEPITRAFLRLIAETDERVELPSARLIELLDAEAERDRLRAVVDAAVELVGAHRAWIARLKAGWGAPSEPESHRRAAAIATLGLRVDGEEETT